MIHIVKLSRVLFREMYLLSTQWIQELVATKFGFKADLPVTKVSGMVEKAFMAERR